LQFALARGGRTRAALDRRVIGNAVRWASRCGSPYHGKGRNIAEPLSPISSEHTVDESLHRPK